MIIPLSQLEKGAAGIIQEVKAAYSTDQIAQRLRELGFLPGELVRVTARAPVSADPLLVQIGATCFALRNTEAARVLVTEYTSHDA